MSEKKTFSAQDERLNALHKRILEMKKKIHLSEGQRKSWFEDCNSRNKENIQKIVVLKKENKTLQAEPKNFNVDQNTECNSTINNINPTDSKKIITNYEKEKHDESILRLRKKIDYLIWNKEKKKNTLCKILNSYKKVKNKKLKHVWKELSFVIKQKIINLENQLQRLNIMQMEADTINKKYKSVRVSLNLDAACYNSSLCKLEENNSDIADEVTRLEEARAGALYLRDYTKNILDTQESSTMIISNDWDKIILSYRKKVDDRKLEYDRIERAIYPAVHLTSEDNCDAYKAQETYDEKVSVPLAIKLRKAIVNLQNAAEVTEKKDVLNQFFKQRSLKQKLQNIRSETEGEKISLENKRQVLSTEVEIKKFADAEDTNQRNEELISILELAENEKVRQRIIIQKNRNIQDLTRIIFLRFRKLYTKIPNLLILDSLKQMKSSVEHLQKVKDIIESQINISPAVQGYFVKEQTVNNKQEDVPIEKENSSVEDRQEGEQLFPLFYNTSALVVPQVQLSEDEDEIASRSLIKKQAQFLVDTKSRRKEDKMSEEKCENVNVKSNNNTTMDAINDSNVPSSEQLQKETLSTDFDTKNNKIKYQLDSLKTKSEDKKKMLLERKLKKIDPESIKKVTIKKAQAKKKSVKRTKNQSSDTLSSISITNIADKNCNNLKNNIRQMEIDSLNNLITSLNQEEENENNDFLPISGSSGLPPSQEQTIVDQTSEVKNIKKKKKCNKKMKINDSEAREIDKIIENLSSYKIPVESNCRHIFASSDAQLRSGDEMESILFVCVLCGESKDYYR